MGALKLQKYVDYYKDGMLNCYDKDNIIVAMDDWAKSVHDYISFNTSFLCALFYKLNWLDNYDTELEMRRKYNPTDSQILKMLEKAFIEAYGKLPEDLLNHNYLFD